MNTHFLGTKMKAFSITVTGIVAGLAFGACTLGVASAGTSATQTVTWSDTSISNGESTSLDYVMGGVSGYVAQWYDDTYVGCSWKRNTNSSYPITYEAARTTTSRATTWWVGLYSTDCTATTAANPPAKADAISSSTLTMTPAGPFGPADITVSDTTETGLTLHWAADALATSYLVYQDDVLVATLTAADLEYAVTGLSAGTTYSFRVVGSNDDFAGIGSSVSVQTTSAPTLANTGTDPLGIVLAAFVGAGLVASGTAFARRARK